MAISSTTLLSLVSRYHTRNRCVDQALLRFALQKDYVYATGYLLPTLYPQDTTIIETFYRFDHYRILYENVTHQGAEFFLDDICYGQSNTPLQTLYALNKLADRHIVMIQSILRNRSGYEGYDYTKLEKKIQDAYTEYSNRYGINLTNDGTK